MAKSERRYQEQQSKLARQFHKEDKEHTLQGNINRFVLTQKQAQLSDVIDNNVITFLEAPAGTGKSSTVLFNYCKRYLTSKEQEILVIRTPVEANEDRIGFLPDDKKAKLEPHFAAYRKILTDFLGPKFNADFEKRIIFDIPNFQLGCTWDNKLVLIDEAQQLPPMILKLLLERIGVNTKVVVCGDPTQLYVGGKRNALTDAVNRFTILEGSDRKSIYNDVGYFKMSVDDVMRSDVVRTVIKAYSE